MLTPSGTTTFLSMIALLVWAPGPILTLSMITLRLTPAPVATYTSVPITEDRTAAPETIEPAQTMASSASADSTNLAPGSWEFEVKIGHWLLYRLNTGS